MPEHNCNEPPRSNRPVLRPARLYRSVTLLRKLNRQRRHVARDVPKHAEIDDGTVFWCLFNLLKTPLNALWAAYANPARAQRRLWRFMASKTKVASQKEELQEKAG